MNPVSLRPLLIFLSLPVALLAQEQSLQTQAGTWPIQRLKSEIPAFRVEDEKARIQSLIYEGEVIAGKPTEVFAFYASPKTLGTATDDEKFPGIVLIHGGGGTA
ncbi:MAG TPA: acylamino acid-releasing protein, partial [Verrucomicrobiales bacterium]|nr:acylamino acid-releasing protein [Verrucomicrobiales bacterium]